jgi:hypothetical protein
MERLECLIITKIDVISKDYQTEDQLSISDEQELETSSPELSINNSAHGSFSQMIQNFHKTSSPNESINYEITLKETPIDDLSPNESINSEIILKESQKNRQNFQDISSGGMINLLIIFDKLNSFLIIKLLI